MTGPLVTVAVGAAGVRRRSDQCPRGRPLAEQKLTNMVSLANVTNMAREEIVNVAAAKARLSELVERASAGEPIILSRNGKPKARLVPIVQRKNYVYGAGRGRWGRVGRVLGTTLPDEVLDAFEVGPIVPGGKPVK